MTAAASVAVHLAAQGYQVRLVSAVGEEIEHGWHDTNVAVSVRPLLESLAVLPTVATNDLYTGWIDDSVTAGMCIAILGELDQHDRAVLSGLHHRGSASYALVLDVDTWAARSALPTAPKRSGELSTAGWLRRRGWKAAELPRGGSLQAAWQELGR